MIGLAVIERAVFQRPIELGVGRDAILNHHLIDDAFFQLSVYSLRSTAIFLLPSA